MALDPLKDRHKGVMDLEPKKGDNAILLADGLYPGKHDKKGDF